MDNLALESIKELFFNKEDEFEDKLLEFHPFDISQVVLDLDEDDKAFFLSLNVDTIAVVLSALETEDFIEYISDIKPQLVSNILTRMYFDDAVDVLKALDEEESIILLRLMDEEHRNTLKQLMNYKEDTAGAIMTSSFIDIPVHYTVKQAMKKVIDLANEVETINVIYVTDKDKLVGVITLRSLIIARADEDLKEIMNTNLIYTTPLVDQIVAAETMMNYDFTVLPVVNKNMKLLGIVTSDDVMDVIDFEAVEDISALAGVTDADIHHDTETVLSSVKKRFPWLVVLLAVGSITSIIIASYEETINQVPILAVFLPLILGLSGNTGTQSLAVTIRGLSTNQFVDKIDVLEHLWREFKTALLNGFILGILVFIMANGMGYIIGESDYVFSFVIALSVYIAIIMSTIAGAMIPLLINALKMDPAVASGPFITTMNDIISLTVYLTLATIFITQLS